MPPLFFYKKVMYVSLEEVKEFLGISNNDYDNILENIIKAVEKDIIGDRKFIKGDYTWRQAPVGGQNIILISEKFRPLNTLSLVNIVYPSGEKISIQAVKINEISIRVLDEIPEGVLLEISGNVGYFSEVPDDFKQLVKELVKIRFDSIKGGENVKSKKIGQISVEFKQDTLKLYGDKIKDFWRKYEDGVNLYLV